MMSGTQRKLDELYQHIQHVILSRQHPVTGLFPASTSISVHGNYTDAWVRDNVYSIQAIWALYLAHKRHGNPQQRAHELEFSCVKMMRGLLFAMMRQSHKVESFKHSLDPKDALHAKYDTKTGLEAVADDAWGHLQIDATSFYLLMLAQMTKAGTTLIFTHDEVNFVQNLIYYISRTYRTPDYGIWERGNKVNNGKAEINASSVGMAKAAMEALDGLNLFGHEGPEWAVIHSFADAVARAGSVLESLLPKESRSKEVDSALLSIIGFPAFAVNDDKLARRTRQEIINKLGGEYGCKRFLLDGHQSAVEDQSRIYYEYDELINFEHIESEWPLFFTYLYIDRLFARDWESANHYRRKLDALMVEKDGQMLLPELYYVAPENILAEKENPGSQPRIANDNLPLVWAQSLYLVGKMLDEELITADDLDPLGLHKIQFRRHTVRTSMVVLAQTESVKTRLVNAGVLCQTLTEIAPLKAISAEQLVNIYRHLGASNALGLTGRPNRALNSLATSQLFCINDENYLCLSWIQNEDKDYRKLDPILFKEHICNELNIINANWYYPANAVFTVLIDEAMSVMPESGALFDFLKQLQQHELTQFEIIAQSAKNAFKSGSRRSITLAPSEQPALGANLPINEKAWPLSDNISATSGDYHAWSSERLLTCLNNQPTINEAITCLEILAERQELSLLIPSHEDKITAYDVLHRVYTGALINQEWYAVRRLYALMITPTTDLATYIADITVRQRHLVLGENHHAEIHITQPLTKYEILELLQRISSSPISLVLNHEFISIVGTMIKIHPDYFAGLRTIRLYNLIALCARQFSTNDDDNPIEILANIPPSRLYATLQTILEEKHQQFIKVASGLSYGGYHANVSEADMKDVDWFDWRVEQGMITKLPENLLAQLWESLSRCNRIIFGDAQSNTTLDCQRTLNSMTQGEDTFALLIESLTYAIHPSWYKNLIIEALYAFMQFCAQHPEAEFIQDVNLPLLVGQAAEDFGRQQHASHPDDMTLDIGSLDEFAQLSPSKVNQYLRWSVSKLHTQQQAAQSVQPSL